MPGKAYDQMWEKRPDGSMHLIEERERTMSDAEIAYAGAHSTLRAFRDNDNPTAVDLRDAVRAVAYILMPPHLDPEEVTPPKG